MRERDIKRANTESYTVLVSSLLGLYTILPPRILYGVWHTTGGSVGGRILRNGRAIALQ